MNDKTRGTTAECPAHGSYRSWEFGWEGIILAKPMMSGCPRCVLEHHQAKSGYGTPSLAEPHRPKLAEEQISESVPAVPGEAGEQR